MISFLKTVLIILLVYMALKFLIKWLTPYFMRFILKKAAQRFENNFGPDPFQQSSAQDQDEITIEKPPKNRKSNGKVVGEYVDFEEVE